MFKCRIFCKQNKAFYVLKEADRANYKPLSYIKIPVINEEGKFIYYSHIKGQVITTRYSTGCLANEERLNYHFS